MLTIPVIYDETTKRIAVSEEWAGTVIDDRSTMFSVSGIPSDAVSAKLDVKVAIKQSNKKTIRPFLILNGIESGTGTATVPYELFYACKRDLKFIFQLEIMTEEETYASENWITMKVSSAIVRRPSELPLWDQDRVLVDAYEVGSDKIVFKRFSGEEFSILLSDNPVYWDQIIDKPIINTWATATERTIPTAKLVKDTLDEKTDKLDAVPEWAGATTYRKGSIVSFQYKLFQSLANDNQGLPPTEYTEYWQPITSSGQSGDVFIATIGDGTTTEFEIEHNLGTVAYLINIINTTTGMNVSARVQALSPNKIKLTFTDPPAEKSITVTIAAGFETRHGYSLDVTTASTTWTFAHYLKRCPNVQTWDYDNNQIIGNISSGVDVTTITFKHPQTGRITLS